MASNDFLIGIGILLRFVGFVIFGRVMISWLVAAQILSPTNPIVNALFSVTEPILDPIRKVIPRVGMFDFSPMLVMIFLFVAAEILQRS